MNYLKNKLHSKKAVALAIFVLGSIWGFAEMTLGGMLHTIHFPNTGAIMGGIGISLMTIFLTMSKKPLLAPLVGLVAASFKPFSALIFGQAVFSAYVLNPMIAIMTEAVLFGIVTFALHKAMQKNVFAKGLTGFLSGGLSLVVYAAIASSLSLGKWPYLAFADKLHTIYSSGLPMALIGMAALVIAHYAASFSIPRFNMFRTLYPKTYYSLTFSLVALCWAVPPFLQMGS